MYALTIAGGKGERLKPLTSSLPKPMVDVNGRPLLHHQACMLIANGVTDIVFLCGYLGETIREYFGDGSEYGFRAHYSFEAEPLGRGGALRLGLSHVPADERFVFALNGDVLTGQPLQELITHHERLNATATIMLVPYVSNYGLVESENGMVTKFVEGGVLPHWINGGVYLLNRDVAPLFPAKGDHEDSTFPLLAERGALACVQSRAPWQSVDSFKDRERVARMLRDGTLSFN